MLNAQNLLFAKNRLLFIQHVAFPARATRPLADVSAPKHTAIGPLSFHEWRAFLRLKTTE
jgi:hypothetical protein